MRKWIISVWIFMGGMPAAVAQEALDGLRGDPQAIAAAEAMVESMGGRAIWAGLKAVHFTHDWYTFNRPDVYREDEILDMTGARSWVEMRSEIYHRVRVYSPENGYWNIVNGQFARESEERFQAAMVRAPFNLYRMARAVARGDSYYEVRFGESDIRGARMLEFSGPDGEAGGYITLNDRNEPLVWATNQYRYTFGPMQQYGSMRIPRWAVYGNGATMYEIVAFSARSETPEATLFVPPVPDSD